MKRSHSATTRDKQYHPSTTIATTRMHAPGRRKRSADGFWNALSIGPITHDAGVGSNSVRRISACDSVGCKSREFRKSHADILPKTWGKINRRSLLHQLRILKSETCFFYLGPRESCVFLKRALYAASYRHIAGRRYYHQCARRVTKATDKCSPTGYGESRMHTAILVVLCRSNDDGGAQFHH